MNKKELSERKQKILNALVDEYIMSAQPISSKDIQIKYLPEISSATIRSELASLEEMGYIEQPHTSAGRIPLPEAYKNYVEKAVGTFKITKDDISIISSRFEKNLGDIKKLSQEAAKIISDSTNYTSVFVSKTTGSISIQEVKLVPLSNNKAIVLVVTDSGTMADKTIEIPKDASFEGVDAASRIINKVFSGKNLIDVERFPDEIEIELEELKQIFNSVVLVIKDYCKSQKQDVYVEGALKMLDYPECEDIENAKKFLQIIENDESIVNLVSNGAKDIEYSIKIGRDVEGGIEKCAIVTAQYKINGKVLGQAGVIGPERMDYKRVLCVLEGIKESLSSMIEIKELGIKHDDEGDKNG